MISGIKFYHCGEGKKLEKQKKAVQGAEGYFL